MGSVKVSENRDDTVGRVGEESKTGSSDETGRARIDWEDPKIPVGNAPPLPRWPLVVAGMAWLAWVAFLVVMMQTE
jgi:hypothetical protein